jgi:hypothetical protein
MMSVIAKIDALMALCDQLGAGLISASRFRLLEALQHEAREPEGRVKEEGVE